jgi:hypothetical protein
LAIGYLLLQGNTVASSQLDHHTKTDIQKQSFKPVLSEIINNAQTMTSTSQLVESVNGESISGVTIPQENLVQQYDTYNVFFNPEYQEEEEQQQQREAGEVEGEENGEEEEEGEEENSFVVKAPDCQANNYCFSTTFTTVTSIHYMSCRDRCNDPATLPCSCDVRCVVYDSCCSDIQVYCDNTYQNAHIKYAELVSVNPRIECEHMSNNLVIASCPGQGQTHHGNDKAPTSLGSYYYYYDALLDLINNAPFTDLDSGFTYKNKDIFTCNTEGT